MALKRRIFLRRFEIFLKSYYKRSNWRTDKLIIETQSRFQKMPLKKHPKVLMHGIEFWVLYRLYIWFFFSKPSGSTKINIQFVIYLNWLNKYIWQAKHTFDRGNQMVCLCTCVWANLEIENNVNTTNIKFRPIKMKKREKRKKYPSILKLYLSRIHFQCHKFSILLRCYLCFWFFNFRVLFFAMVKSFHFDKMLVLRRRKSIDFFLFCSLFIRLWCASNELFPHIHTNFPHSNREFLIRVGRWNGMEWN